MVKKRGSSMVAKETQALLVENFVGLQKAMTHLSIKFEALSDQISRLLQVFETSAKYYMHGGLGDTERELVKKLDTLAQQDKIIAYGLVSLEEMMREREEREKERESAEDERAKRAAAVASGARAMPAVKPGALRPLPRVGI